VKSATSSLLGAIDLCNSLICLPGHCTLGNAGYQLTSNLGSIALLLFVWDALLYILHPTPPHAAPPPHPPPPGLVLVSKQHVSPDLVNLMYANRKGSQNHCPCDRVCRSYVAQGLTASFRSHTAVSPHDWQTYEEMRTLALDKHHLHLGAIDLPTQAPDQSKAARALPEC